MRAHALAIGVGIGASGKLGVGGREWRSVAARGMVASTVTQGVGVALGMQSKFSWAGVAAAGVSAGVITQIGQAEWFRGMESVAAQRVITGTAGAAANAATRSLLEGTDFGDNLIAALPDVIGQTIGASIAGAVSREVYIRRSVAEFGEVIRSAGATLEDQQQAIRYLEGALRNDMEFLYNHGVDGSTSGYRPQSPAELRAYNAALAQAADPTDVKAIASAERAAYDTSIREFIEGFDTSGLPPFSSETSMILAAIFH